MSVDANIVQTLRASSRLFFPRPRKHALVVGAGRGDRAPASVGAMSSPREFEVSISTTACTPVAVRALSKSHASSRSRLKPTAVPAGSSSVRRRVAPAPPPQSKEGPRAARVQTARRSARPAPVEVAEASGRWRERTEPSTPRHSTVALASLRHGRCSSPLPSPLAATERTTNESRTL
jgi:hypothetical protein